MKKKQKLNLKKIKIANVNTVYALKGGLSEMTCATYENTCPKSYLCIDNTNQETCTTMGNTECATLTTIPVSDHCNGVPTGACSD